MKIAIVENEEKERRLLREHIVRFSEENNVFCSIDEYSNGVDFLTENPGYDAVFLDIQMPLMDGMETAERLRKTDEEMQIVFVTNMAQYALEGYRVNALDFLVKPINYVDILLELKKIVKIQSGQKEFMWITGAGSYRKIDYSEIYYIEIFNHTVTVHTKTEKVSFRGSLKDVENKLDKKQFSRPDNCYIVNLRYVKRIEGDCLLLDKGQELHISRARRKNFFSDLSRYINKSGN